jgi:hypothetical protein
MGSGKGQARQGAAIPFAPGIIGVDNAVLRPEQVGRGKFAGRETDQ